MFSTTDIAQFEKKGISPEKVQQQIDNFKSGFPYADITRAATPGDGILKINFDDKRRYDSMYDAFKTQHKIVKFVPASGAASRMFKALFNILNNYDGNTDFLKEEGFASPAYFFKNIEKFAFFKDLKAAYEKKYGEFDRTDYKNILKSLLTEEGLNYGNLPKGLLKFHAYDGFERTPVEEHIIEAILYGNTDNYSNIHFTVSPEHIELFKKHIDQTKPAYEEKHQAHVKVDFSVQKPSTDTIAVDMQNEAFREEDGSILFRPGGHGALIENLNDIDADAIFIKNIDNVVPDSLKQKTVDYKKVIGGILVDIRVSILYLAEALSEKPSKKLIDEALNFFKTRVFYEPPQKFKNFSFEEKVDFLLEKLNRPIRVCGMVKNEGEPGGGPFFVRNSDGDISLQIVEASQIDPDDAEKQKIVSQATHFNPVDIVCSTKDYKKNKFDLTKFTDPETGFISEKSKDGRSLKAQELPGLWNGAMANWTTVFAEVPVETFNPVKIVNDLLRDQHQ